MNKPVEFFLEDFPNVANWPDKWRKLFVLTLPISGPLWLAIMMIAVTLIIAAIFVLAPIAGIVYLWNGGDPK